VLVLLREAGPRQARDFRALAPVFGLTAAEAEVAAGLAAGKTAEEIAADRSTSLNTARTQIRAVLGKLEPRICAILSASWRRCPSG
jgi:DNA-binding CsgD family transcriptional regulator